MPNPYSQYGGAGGQMYAFGAPSTQDYRRMMSRGEIIPAEHAQRMASVYGWDYQLPSWGQGAYMAPGGTYVNNPDFYGWNSPPSSPTGGPGYDAKMQRAQGMPMPGITGPTPLNDVGQWLASTGGGAGEPTMPNFPAPNLPGLQGAPSLAGIGDFPGAAGIPGVPTGGGSMFNQQQWQDIIGGGGMLNGAPNPSLTGPQFGAYQNPGQIPGQNVWDTRAMDGHIQTPPNLHGGTGAPGPQNNYNMGPGWMSPTGTFYPPPTSTVDGMTKQQQQAGGVPMPPPQDNSWYEFQQAQQGGQQDPFGIGTPQQFQFPSPSPYMPTGSEYGFTPEFLPYGGFDRFMAFGGGGDVPGAGLEQGYGTPFDDFYQDTLSDAGTDGADLLDLFNQDTGGGNFNADVQFPSQGLSVPLDPVVNQRQIQQLLNNALGGNAALESQGLRDAAESFAGRGFTSGSPAMQGVANRLNLNRMIADTTARRDIPIQAQQANADHLISSLEALARQRGLDISSYVAQTNALTGAQSAFNPILTALISGLL